MLNINLRLKIHCLFSKVIRLDKLQQEQNTYHVSVFLVGIGGNLPVITLKIIF